MSAFADRLPIFCECGDHAFVALTRGFVTLVSPQDAPLLWDKWFAKPYVSGRAQVCREIWKGPYLHLAAVILQPADGFVADHVDCNPLDNRRHNIRPATPAQNAQNRPALKRKLPKGVWQRGGRFCACIHVEDRTRHLGTFASVDEAHAAYIDAATECFGEFARAA